MERVVDGCRWLAKNSSGRKRSRLLSDLAMHTNSRISGGRNAIRMDYFDLLLQRFYGCLRSEDGVDAAIELLDSYGLSRDDMMDSMSELVLFKEEIPVVDGKAKAAFTRQYVAPCLWGGCCSSLSYFLFLLQCWVQCVVEPDVVTSLVSPTCCVLDLSSLLSLFALCW